MAFDKKKPSVGLGLLAIAKKKSGLSDSGDGDMGGSDADSEDSDKATMAMDDLADCLGVPDEKRDDFYRYFKTAVAAVDDDSDLGGDEGDETAAAV